MKLRDLEGTFVCYHEGSVRKVGTLAEAHGVRFNCPQCPSGTHVVGIWFIGCGVPDELGAGRRWSASGTNLDDLSLMPSVNFDSGKGACRWHGWVKNGEAA